MHNHFCKHPLWEVTQTLAAVAQGHQPADTVIRGGGMVAVADGKVLGLAKLPIAGLMNDESAEEMAADVATLEEAWKTIGCSMPSPFMTMALIPLACLPDLRLTNRGLVDCRTFQFVPLVVEE